VFDVLLSVAEAPVSVAAVMSGVVPGVVGAVVSTVIDKPGEAADVPPDAFVAV
jgi:hypothetical protein